VPIFTLIIGTILGIFANFLSSFVRKRETISIKIFDEIIEARNEVAEVVCELALIPTKGEKSRDYIIQARDSITKLFYKYYDFLPEQVLNTLLLLEVALDYPSKGPYKLHENKILPLDKDEIFDFIKKCTRVENGLYSASILLQNSSAAVVSNEVIRLHARNVLYMLNQYASLGTYIGLTNDLRKKIR